MLIPSRQTRRRAAALLESAFVFLVLLTLILGLMDLGIALFRQELLEEAARQGARQAIVHGEKATASGVWGPAAIGPIPASDANPLAQAIQPSLIGFDPSAVTVQARWLDGGNAEGQRVQVTVSTPYALLFPFLYGLGPSLSLSATSTMPIAH